MDWLIEGCHIDHVYVLGLQAHVELYSPYYTAKDHDGLLITIKDDIMNKEVQESTTWLKNENGCQVNSNAVWIIFFKYFVAGIQDVLL